MADSNASVVEPNGARSTYVAGLDGLRAIAVVSVFLGHVSAHIGYPIGVDMFFALSGFLITRGLIRELEESGRVNLKLFYLRRVLRLMPALIAMIGLLLVVAAALGERPLLPHVFASVTALTYVMNWTRAFGLGFSGWLGHTWSLSIEEQFYLLWPLILMVTYRWGGVRASLCFAGILAILSLSLRMYLYHIGATEDRIYNGFDTRADGLLIGCMLALAKPFSLAAVAGRLWPVPAVALASSFLFIPWQAFGTLSFTIIPMACAWLTLSLWAGTSPEVARIMEAGPIRYVGRISYGLYLWHWPILNILSEYHFHNKIAVVVAEAVLTLCLAAMSFHFIEQPVLRLKERIAPRWSGTLDLPARREGFAEEPGHPKTVAWRRSAV